MLNLGEFQHNPDISGSGASITRRATAQNSPQPPQVKREDSTRKRQRKAAVSVASEDEEEEKDDSQLPSNIPDADIPLIRRLIAAMTDGRAYGLFLQRYLGVAMK